MLYVNQNFDFIKFNLQKKKNKTKKFANQCRTTNNVDYNGIEINSMILLVSYSIGVHSVIDLYVAMKYLRIQITVVNNHWLSWRKYAELKSYLH